MKKLGTALFLAAIFLLPLRSYGEPVKVRSTIVSVTVFSDRAIVTRSARVKAIPGEAEVELAGLPMALIEDSVRVTSSGTARGRITGVELKKNFLEEWEDKKLKALKDELEVLEDRDKALKDRIKNLKSRRKFLESIKLKASDDLTKDIEYAKVDVQQWQGVVDFYIKNLEKNDSDLRAEEIKRRKLLKKIRALRKAINARGSAKPKGTMSARVGLELVRAGNLTIELSYAIFGAGWSPSYDVRAGSDKEAVELTYYGEVWQKTGEEWKGVDVTLSTARPSIGAEVPELPPWYVGAPIFLDEYKAKGYSANKRLRRGGLMLEAAPVAEKAEEDVLHELLKPMTAEVAEGWTSTTFKIRKKAEILPDGSVRRVTISTAVLKGAFEYEIVPKLMEYAFLKAEVENTEEYPILSGPANVFVDNNFIGVSRIKTTAPGEKLNLSLGVDEGVKVERKITKSERGRRGIISNKLRTTMAFMIKVSNYKKHPAKITVVDQVPVSQSKDITVKLLGTEPKPAPDEKDEPGILKWKMEVPVGETAEITFGFQADYPKDEPLDLF